MHTRKIRGVFPPLKNKKTDQAAGTDEEQKTKAYLMFDAHGPPLSRRPECCPSVAAVRRAARSFLADHAPLFVTGTVRREKFPPRQLRGVAVNRLRRALWLRGGGKTESRTSVCKRKERKDEKEAMDYTDKHSIHTTFSWDKLLRIIRGMRFVDGRTYNMGRNVLYYSFHVFCNLGDLPTTPASTPDTDLIKNTSFGINTNTDTQTTPMMPQA